MDVIDQARDVIGTARGLLTFQPLDLQFSIDDLDAAAVALSAVRLAASNYLDTTSGGATDTQVRRVATLLIRAEHIQAVVLDAMLARRSTQLLDAHDAVAQLRGARSVSDLIQRSTVEAYRMGFDKILFSRIEHGTWIPSTAYAGSDMGLAETIVRVGVAHPRKLTRALIETDMVRRGTPIVVYDPQSNSRVHTEMVAAAATMRYVAAPVLMWGEPVGFLHADRRASDGLVDEADRDTLGIFAQTVGIGLERNILLGRLRTIRQACNRYAAGVNSLADDFTLRIVEDAGIIENWESPSPDSTPDLRPSVVGDRLGDPVGKLTSREWDVLRGIAAGKTNSQIAIELFVAEGTVKTHVKHVLRKLKAVNRTEAATKYHNSMC